jgi:ankyrin repeat protein
MIVWRLVLSALCAIVAANDSDERLFQACRMGDVNAVLREIEENGVVMNVQEQGSGQTPLMAAVLSGQAQVVQILLNKGADVTIGEKDDYTPPHGAGFQGRAKIMSLLKEHGIDVIRDFHSDGYAPFHRACWGNEQRHSDTVQFLLEIGTDPNMPGNGKTCAEMTRNPATLQVLKRYQDEL